MEIFFSFIGLLISERTFKYAVVEDLFLRKNSEAKPIANFKDLRPYFLRIRFNVWEMFIEPLYSLFCRCCKNSIRSRDRLVKRGFDRFEEELEIGNLLKKVRDCNDNLQMMMSKDQIKMLRFQESKVISTGSEDDESSATSS